MTNAPERIWIEDEFGDGDDDQWTYGTWDVRNYAGYVVEYVRADLALPAVQPDALHRSFPEAGDGRPFPPMMNELMTAGLVAEDARFVAIQLAQNGYSLAKITHVNETLKNEHDAANMLTPATKGAAHD